MGVNRNIDNKKQGKRVSGCMCTYVRDRERGDKKRLVKGRVRKEREREGV